LSCDTAPFFDVYGCFIQKPAETSSGRNADSESSDREQPSYPES
jgi:hypothetical protein